MTLVADFNPAVSVPFSRMRQLLFEQGGGIQEGVVGANDLKVVQRGAGANMSVDVPAGAAWVQIDTSTRNGLGHVYNDATANVVVTASNGTNPRIDQIILRWNDSSIPTGSGNVPTLEVLTGTATVGATLDNRTGAAALPNDCLRLADILVPTSSTSVTTANIRDRRPWARGANAVLDRSGTADLTTVSTTYVDLDTTNLRPRVECSGLPLAVTLNGTAFHGTASQTLFFQLALDGTAVANSEQWRTVAVVTAGVPLPAWVITPAAGTHLIAPQWKVAAGTGTISGAAPRHLSLAVQEIVRSNANNT